MASIVAMRASTRRLKSRTRSPGCGRIGRPTSMRTGRRPGTGQDRPTGIASPVPISATGRHGTSCPTHSAAAPGLKVFIAPSRLEDDLTFALAATRLGGASCTLRHRISADADLRFEATQTIVHVGSSLKPEPWPDALRSRMAPWLETAA